MSHRAIILFPVLDNLVDSDMRNIICHLQQQNNSHHFERWRLSTHIISVFKRNRVNHDIRKAKREFFLNSLETQSPNPRVIWNHNKSSLATTSAVQPRLTIQNFQPQPHAKMMADQFNEHFATITSTFGTTATTVNQSNYTRLRTYIRQKNPENVSFKLPNITT